jgi:hypothetical protein
MAEYSDVWQLVAYGVFGFIVGSVAAYVGWKTGELRDQDRSKQEEDDNA